MSSLRGGLSAFWTSIRDLVDTDDVTHTSLYVEGIQRLADRSMWLLGAIDGAASDLASASLGTAAKVTGSVDLSTLVYDPIAGALNGRTIQIQSDTSAVITVTFGVGAGLAPTGPADVVTAILAASSGNPSALVGPASNLKISSATTGGTGVITIIGGSALALLGFTAGQTATGASAGGDGISRIAGAAITGASFNLAAGTLRSMLQTVANGAASAAAFATLAARVSARAGGAAGASIARISSAAPIVTGGTWSILGSGDYLTNNIGACDLTILLSDEAAPQGSTLTAVSVPIQPAAHASIAGLTLPQLGLYKISNTGVSTQIGGTVVDPSPNATAYSLLHSLTLTLSGPSEVIDRSAYRYAVQVTSEHVGANAIVGCYVFGAVATTTIL